MLEKWKTTVRLAIHGTFKEQSNPNCCAQNIHHDIRELGASCRKVNLDQFNEKTQTSRISLVEIEEALLHNDPEMIEDYPDDPRGHSFLLLGFSGEGKPIHALCSIHEGTLVIITIYRPDPNLWVDWKIRRDKI